MANSLQVYRQGQPYKAFDIDEKTVFSEKLPGTRMISCPILAPVALDLEEEDYIIFDDEQLSINLLPEVEKGGSSLNKPHTITFEAAFYRLLDKYIRSSVGKRTFSLYGSARDHLEMFIASAGDGWTLGEVDDTIEENIDYNDTYIRPGLDIIAEKFKLEWNAKNKVITMVKTIGRDTGLVFEVGRGRGLHKIARKPDTSKNVVTRAFGKGGTRNITSKYRSGTETNLIFEGEYVETPGVTAGTQRVKEATYENEAIFPHFKGVVASTVINRDDQGKIVTVTITDPAIDFDLNLQLQEGVKAKVGFLTGPLTGVEFEIASYVHATRTTTLIPNTDANGYILPNDLNFPEVGDKWTYYDIIMPDSYFVASELQLRTETFQWLQENSLQNLLFDAVPDEKHLRNNQIRLRAGDNAQVLEADFGVDEILRFTEISFPVVNPFKVTATVGNKIVYNKITKLFADVLQTQKEMQVIDRRGQEIAKRGAKNLRVLEESIFDVEGNFDSSKYNVGVLSALLGIFGIQSANFLLNRVFITGNYGGDPNAVQISEGELFHLEYSNPGNQNVWQMQMTLQTGLVAGQGYYVYSKLSKTSQVGSFLITTDQLRPDALPGFYTVRTGFIYPQIDGLRDVDFTYGITTVNGRQIKAGEIRGNTNAVIINLDTGEIFGDLRFRAADGSVKTVINVASPTARAASI